MNRALNAIDFAALSPLLILIAGAATILLIESFSEKSSKKFSGWLGCFTLIIGTGGAIFAPGSENLLLRDWIVFDSFTRFFSIFFLLIGLASCLLAVSFFQRFETSRGEYYFFLLSSIFGLILIASAADFLTLFLGLETLSIALYVLCGYMKKWEASKEAAVKYFLIGALATSFLLYGIALVYGAAGTTYLGDLMSTVQSVSGNSKVLLQVGIALVTLGFAFKAAIVPFHVWAPDVYDGAPNPVTAFMAVGTKVGAFAAFARVFLFALPGFDPIWSQMMTCLAILTMVYASILALRQTQMRRFFAYSGISHAGFLLIPIIVGTQESIPALSFYLVIYAIATFGCFAVLSFLDQNSEGVFLKDLRGLFYRSPFLAGVLTLCLLTLAGVPPTAGFFAKFYVFKIAFENGNILLVIVGLLTTILSIYYYMRIISTMFSQRSQEDEHSFEPYSWAGSLMSVVSFVSILIFSCFPELLMHLLR